MSDNRMIVRNMDDVVRSAKALAASGYFQDAASAQQAAVKVMAGFEMGFGPFASLTGLHIIKGKPAIGSNLIAAAIKRHPMYQYKVTSHTEKECTIQFFEKWGGRYEAVGDSSFTIADAAKAGLSTNPKNETWKKYPKNMLFSRAISNGAKWYCPDVFGGSPTYTPEELGAEVDEDENVITGEIIEEPEYKREEIIEALGFDEEPELKEDSKIELLRAQITEKAQALGVYNATDNQRQLLRHLLDDIIFQDKGDKRHQILFWLFGNQSLKAEGGISGAEIKIMLDWLSPVKDSGGAYAVKTGQTKACFEIARQEEIDKGQIELEI